MSFPDNNYAPPGVFTKTIFDSPLSGTQDTFKLPVIVGEGNETLLQTDLEIVRGSSSSVDQRRVGEDETSRAVLSVSSTGVVSLAAFNGVLDKFRVQHYPIVDGSGKGTVTTNRGDVAVTINGSPIMVRSVDGTRGIVQLTQAPLVTDLVRCTYYFKRTDTRITDDVSEQVPARLATVRAGVGIGDVNAPNPTSPVTVLNFYSDVLNLDGTVNVPANNVLLVTVDGTDRTLTIPPRTNYTMAQVASAITALHGGTLIASTFVNQFGQSALSLYADCSLSIRGGSANALLGLISGQADNRTSTFYVFNGPMVTGDNSGAATTDTSTVVVKVNNVQVIPAAVNGSTRAVTLSVAPKQNATVTIQYYFNTWQDTFDYLADVGVTSVLRCDPSPGSGTGTYIQGTDFVLQDDKILWGTAVTVAAGTTTAGYETFDSTQISGTLVDNQTFLAPCLETTDRYTFTLPFVPTLGNGRNTPLGQDLFQTVSNGRIDLPVDRPDVISAYWGYDVQSALENGRLDILKVDGINITLKNPVPAGATVYTSGYFNVLTDETYTLTVLNPGLSGVGTYTMQNSVGEYEKFLKYTTGSKGSALTGVTLEFPSGSELMPDFRYEAPTDTTYYTGPVDEIVTVQLASKVATPAKYAVPGAGEYEFIRNASDRLRLQVHSVEVGTSAGIDLAIPSLVASYAGGGYFASLVSDEIIYTGGSGAGVVAGQNFEIPTASEEFTLGIDGVDVPVKTDATYYSVGTLEMLGTVAAPETLTFNGTILTSKNLGPWAATDFKDAQAPNSAADSASTLAAAINALGLGLVADNASGAAFVRITATTRGTSGFTMVASAPTHILVTPMALPATSADLTFYADAINEAAGGHYGTCFGGSGNTSIVLGKTVSNGTISDIDNYYVGWKVVIGNGGATAAGTTRTITAYNGATKTATVAIWPGPTPPVITNPYYIYNPDSRACLTGTTAFDGPISTDADKFDKLLFVYVGNVSTTTGTLSADLGPGPFATVSALATEVSTRMAAVIPAAAHSGLVVECTANASGQLEFRLQLPGVDAEGYLQFIANAAPAKDFAILAGLDAALTLGGGQAALVQGPVARTYECPASGTPKLYDRLILRNRILPGGITMAADSQVALCSLEVKSDNEKAGLFTGMFGVAGSAAVVHPATLASSVSLSGGQMAVTFEPIITFYDGTGVRTANDHFSFTIDGTPVDVSFTSTDAGTATALGPITTAGSVLGQIVAAMAAVPGAPWGIASAIIATNLVRQEGVGIRLTSAVSGTTSEIVIGDATTAVELGFSSGSTALRTLVSAKNLASALMSHRHVTFGTWLLTIGTATTISFTNYGFASTVEDGMGSEYLYLQDAPTAIVDLGAASNVILKDTNGSVDNALRYTTGLGAVDGDGATGDAALNGFFVISNNPVGSGSVNDSILNNMVGQDGVIGQTYHDSVTGFTFTLLPRNWATDSYGPWVAYPTGANATFRINIGTTFTTDANLPQTSIPGVELLVANTYGMFADDTATVTSHERGGQEPGVGDLYYVTYTYTKQDFGTRFYTKFSSVSAAYGVLSPDNPVSLATYLAMINGAVTVGIKQVQKDTDSTQASVTAYRDAIDELEGPLLGQVQPDMITLMRADSNDLYLYLKRSNALMSSMRYKSERTSILGMVAGSTPTNVIYTATQLSDTRMRVVYPDMATITIQDNNGANKEYLIDGPFLAAALTGQVLSPNTDVATPWTGRRLVGFNQLGRQLDAVEQNQIAVKGVTVLEDRPPYIRVRHGLTTDMTNTLTKLPTIVLIADEVQKQARSVLEQFIGIKFLPGVLSQIEGRLAMLLKQLVAAQIISAYTGVKANVSASDPTCAEIQAYFSPIFPLLYLILTFNLRSSL